MVVEMTVARLGLDSSTNSYVVILQEKHGARILPIWIGQPEAESIALQLSQIRRERPLTHDLCKSLILALGGTLHRIQITRVVKSTYFADMHIIRGDGTIQVDARPSDAIAVALRLSAPIFAAESLLTGDDEEGEEVALEYPGSAADAEQMEAELRKEQLKAYLENLRPEDFGKFSP